MENEHNENFIKNLAEDYKEILDKKDKEMKKLAKRHNSLFKRVCVMYCMFRQLDETFAKMDIATDSNIFGALHLMIEQGRSEASSTSRTTFWRFNSLRAMAIASLRISFRFMVLDSSAWGR